MKRSALLKETQSEKIAVKNANASPDSNATKHVSAVPTDVSSPFK